MKRFLVVALLLSACAPSDMLKSREQQKAEQKRACRLAEAAQITKMGKCLMDKYSWSPKDAAYAQWDYDAELEAFADTVAHLRVEVIQKRIDTALPTLARLLLHGESLFGWGMHRDSTGVWARAQDVFMEAGHSVTVEQARANLSRVTEAIKLLRSNSAADTIAAAGTLPPHGSTLSPDGKVTCWAARGPDKGKRVVLDDPQQAPAYEGWFDRRDGWHRGRGWICTH